MSSPCGFFDGGNRYSVFFTYYFDTPVAPSSAVEFQSFTKGEVMLPPWLTFLQADDTSDAYLYGLPEAEDNGKLNLQVGVRLHFDFIKQPCAFSQSR